MNRIVLLATALAAACGGKSAPANELELGSSHVGSTAGATARLPGISAPAPDPALPFRLAYTNPGGMWLPEQMTLPGHVATFKQMGTHLDAATLAKPLEAPLAGIVQVPGCSASFVSDQGLIVTNHHCAQTALQLNSTPESNLVEAGFLAKTLADEKSAGPAARVRVVQAYKDVTHDMRDGIDEIKDPTKRKDELEHREKTLVAACEKDRPAIRCDVRSFFRGGEYELIETLEIRDMRLVYAPPRSIGNYGGEIDNWAWPRHTGDWSYLRAYVGKDGQPADYSPDNVPYRPKFHIKVTDQGLKPGDFVMIAGYPGRTSRTQTGAATHHEVEWWLPYQLAYLKQRYALLEAHVKDGNETAIKAGVAKQRVQNYLEKYEGMLKGLSSGDLMQRKDALDKQIHDWAAQEGHEEIRAQIEKLEKIEAEARRTARVDFDRGNAFGDSGLLGTALSLTRWAEQHAKPDADRKPGYQDRDMPRAKSSQKQMKKSYDRTLDREAEKLALMRALQLPEADRPWLATLLGVKKGAKVDEALIDRTLAAWYEATKLEDEDTRMTLLETGTLKDLKASKDPFIQAAQRVWPIVKAEEAKDDAREGELLVVTPAYVEAMKQVLGGQLSSDANSTLRISYGTVKPIKAGEPAFTVASQIPGKNTGKEPFDAPKALLDAIHAKKFGPYADAALGGELPVDFTCDLDITNGNSGSSVLNDRGELVGLAFDGNIEGVASDVVFDGATTRTIGVDARYMLWVMDAIDGADRLITEMGLQPKL